MGAILVSPQAETTFRSLDEVMAFRDAMGIGDSLVDSVDAYTPLADVDLEAFAKSQHFGAYGGIAEAFAKALQADPKLPNVLERAGATALSLEHVDNTILSLIFSNAEFQFLQEMPRSDVTSTLLEYARITSYGTQQRPNSFVGELQDPNFDDPVLDRMAHNIAFMAEGFQSSRVVGRVAHLPNANPELIGEQAAMMRMNQTKAWAVWYGDRDLRKLEFNGFVKELVDEGQVIDAEGELLEIKEIQEQTKKIRYPGWGQATDFWMSVATKSVYNTVYEDQIRTLSSELTTDLGRILRSINDENAVGSKLNFRTDTFINRYDWEVPKKIADDNKTWFESATGVNPPNPPADVTVANTGSIPDSKWDAKSVNSNPVGYRIVARSETGQSVASAPVFTDNPVVPGQAVDIHITPDITGHKAESFEIWRETMPGNGDFRYVEAIKRNTTSASTYYQDRNAWRPGCEIGVIGSFSKHQDEMRNFTMAVLLAGQLTRFNQGQISLRKLGGMIEEYCGLRIYAPQKFILVKNLPTRL